MFHQALFINLLLVVKVQGCVLHCKPNADKSEVSKHSILFQ